MLERRVRELRELERLLREPRARRRVDDAAPLRIGRRAGDAAVTRTVGLAWHFHPEIGVDQGVTGIRGRRNAETASGWVAPVLSHTSAGVAGRCPVPRTQAVTAGVDDEVSRPRGVSRIATVYPGRSERQVGRQPTPRSTPLTVWTERRPGPTGGGTTVPVLVGARGAIRAGGDALGDTRSVLNEVGR